MPDTTLTNRANGKIKEKRPYTLGEEIANCTVHGTGVALAIAALVLLIVFAVNAGGGVRLFAAIVFGVTLILEYTASTLYHAFPQPTVKYIFKILDHCGIYLLIAGSYTPFCLVTLSDSGGWVLFWVVWSLAFVGIAFEAFWPYRPRWLSAAIYLGLGWIVVFLYGPLVRELDPAGLWLLVAGGLAYTIGTIFYVLKRVPYMHSVWHGFVLAGSALHFLAVLLFVIR